MAWKCWMVVLWHENWMHEIKVMVGMRDMKLV